MTPVIDINKDIDLNPFYCFEDYLGLQKTELSKMNYTDLREELKRAKKEVKFAEEELNNAGNNYPTYTLNQQLKNAKRYVEEVQERICELSIDDIEKGSIDGLIVDLGRQLKDEIISKDFYNKCIQKLEKKRQQFENDLIKKKLND